MTLRDAFWPERAACKGADPESFYPEEGSRFDRSFCRSCGVRQECLDYAMGREKYGARWGLWGGLTPRERSALQRREMGAR